MPPARRATRRLAHVAAHVVAAPFPWVDAPPEAQLVRPSGRSDVRPTTDASVALRNFEKEGFCIVKDALSPSEVAMYRDHLLAVMGDRRHLLENGLRADPAARKLTTPPDPPFELTSRIRELQTERHAVRANAGRGDAFHNGDFGLLYNDECRCGIEGYIRHDPRLAAVGCDRTRTAVGGVIEPLLGEDFRVVYTDGFVEYPGAANLGWHADGPFISFSGKPIDASPRVTTLWMLSDFTPYNGGTWVLPRSHKLPKGEHPQDTWSEEQKQSFHANAVAAAAPAGSVLIVSGATYNMHS